MSESKPSSDALKAQIDELRREWDRLDEHGSQAVSQAQVTKEIERLQKQLKEQSGEDY